MPQSDLRRETKYCSRLGWALVLSLLWAAAWQFVLAAADGLLAALLGLRMPDAAFYLLALVGHYALSLPLSYALCRGIPRTPHPAAPAGARRFGRWFVIGAALMWLGSLLGTRLSSLAYALCGREPVSFVNQAFMDYPRAAVLLGACVFGPICEELLFRGLLAGRLSRYGDKPAAFVSALLFGLYHANLEQFVYAFLLGLLLAYAYFRTGRLRTAILLHMLFNCYGAGLPLLLPERFAPLAFYALSWLALTIAGIILLVRCRKQQKWAHGPCAPSMRAVFVNAGMTLTIIACFVELALNFVLV